MIARHCEAGYSVHACMLWTVSVSLNDRSSTESVNLKLKVGRSIAGVTKLATLPPTNEECIARAHVQVAIWRHTLDADPPSLQPTSHWWEKDSSNSLMYSLAPVQLLKDQMLL